MLRTPLLPLLLLLAVVVVPALPAAGQAPALQFNMKSLDGQDVSLQQFLGKVVLVVNVASQCGLTPQYEQLQQLHEQYAGQGLVILGFPCNQFGQQEPGSAEEIRQFCAAKYRVSFPMFGKIDVNGDQAADLYRYLTAQDAQPKGSGPISWNFEKFVIGRNGQVVARFAPRTRPDAPEVIQTIEAELARQ